MRFLLTLIFLTLVLTGCGSKQEQESDSRTYRDEIREGSPQDKPTEYKRPDGGFGTLDDARDVKGAAEDQEKESERALQDTQ